MGLKYLSNGFIETIFNSQRRDDVVLMKGSPIVETRVTLPPTPQQNKSYAQSGSKNTFSSRIIHKKEERDRKRMYDINVKMLRELELMSQMRNGESTSTGSSKKKGILSKVGAGLKAVKVVGKVAKLGAVLGGKVAKLIGGGLWKALKFVLKRAFLPLMVWQIGKHLFGMLPDSVQDMIIKAFKGVKEFFSNFGSNMVKLYERVKEMLPDSVKEALSTAFTNIKEFFGDFSNNMIKIYESIMAWIPQPVKDLMFKAFKSIKEFFADFSNNMVKIYDTLSDMIPDSVKDLLKVAFEKVKYFFSNFSRIMGNIYESISGVLPDNISGSISDAFNGIKGFFSSFANGISKLFNLVKSVLGTAIDAVGDVFDGVSGTAKSLLGLEGDFEKYKNQTNDIEKQIKKDRELLQNRDKNFFEKTVSVLNGGDSGISSDIRKNEQELAKLRAEAYKKALMAIESHSLDVGSTEEKYAKEVIAQYQQLNKVEEDKERAKISERIRLAKERYTAQEQSVNAMKQSMAYATHPEAKKALTEGLSIAVAKLAEYKAEIPIEVKALADRVNKFVKVVEVADSSVSESTNQHALKGARVNESYYQSLYATETGKRYKNPYDVKNKYGYVGKYQFGKTTAKPYLDKLGEKWSNFRNNPELQEKVVRLHAEHQAKRLTKNGYKVSDFNLWVSHNQGMGGFNDIVNNTSRAPSASAVKRIKANIPKSMAPTKENYIKHWKKKFSDKEHVVSNDSTKQMKELIVATKGTKQPDVVFVDETKNQGTI